MTPHRRTVLAARRLIASLNDFLACLERDRANGRYSVRRQKLYAKCDLFGRWLEAKIRGE